LQKINKKNNPCYKVAVQEETYLNPFLSLVLSFFFLHQVREKIKREKKIKTRLREKRSKWR